LRFPHLGIPTILDEPEVDLGNVKTEIRILK